MGISIAEFRVAMETYGAKKLPQRNGSRINVLVPCFAVGDVQFLHSGTYYIVQRGTKAPEEVMARAMAEFGEKFPGKANFWWGEIHSVKGILTLAAMLEGKYSKELIDELTNTTYKKLVECALSLTYVEHYFQNNHSPEMEKLCKKLAEFRNVVNPFGSDAFKLKEPIEYLDSTKLQVAYKESGNTAVRLNLKGYYAETTYTNDSEGYCYDATFSVQKNRKNGYVNLGHYYTNGSDHKPVDEVVRLYYKAKENYDRNPDDIDLRISLKTGLAWTTYKDEEASPATDEQINLMITHLNICIKKIKRKIIRYMTDNQA